MGPLNAPLRRLALDRPGDHPLAHRVRQAGWEPVPYTCTRKQPSPEPLPEGPWDAALVLSPEGARAAAGRLDPAVPCLATGPGTAAILAEGGFEPITPAEPRAEGLWSELRTRYPQGGRFLLVRGERTRGFLDAAAEGGPWRLVPWVSHREVPADPLPALPPVEAVLALSPFQAEVLAPLARGVLRFAWGERAARAFATAGFPADAWCQPSPEALEALLSGFRTPDTP